MRASPSMPMRTFGSISMIDAHQWLTRFLICVIVDHQIGRAHAVAPALSDYQPTDPQIAWHLAHLVENVQVHSRRSGHRRLWPDRRR